MLRNPADFGTAEEARAMLERAVAAVKEDRVKALDMFNNGEGGFKDRDLYVWCANASDGILTAHPTNKGKELRDIEGKKGTPFGQEIKLPSCYPASTIQRPSPIDCKTGQSA